MLDLPLPQAIDAERAVLGSIMLDREAIVPIAGILHPDDFLLERHAQIYTAALACFNRREPPDLTNIASELGRRDQLVGVGGVTYLSDISVAVPTSFHVEYYARSVLQAAVRRRLIEAGGKIAAIGYSTDEALDFSLDRAEQVLAQVVQRQQTNEFISAEQAVQAYFDQVRRHIDRSSETGISDLDQLLDGGFHAGNLILLAARPGMGKSGLALSIAHHLAVKQQRHVVFVSLEMSQTELMDRLVGLHVGCDTRHVRDKLRAADPDILKGLAQISDSKIHLDDIAGQSIAELRSKVRRLASNYPVDLIIIDYLQLLLTDTRAHSRTDEVSRVSRQLKLLAKELRCPVLAISQLSRAVEMRSQKVPQLSDLRDSGALEQDADIVLFIYRAELYDENATPGHAEIHIAKNRHGPTGMVPVLFIKELTYFANLNPKPQRRTRK